MFGLLVARRCETGNLWIAQTSLRGQCQRQLSIIAVALERYRLAHGTYPETLEPLVEYGLAIDTWMDPCSMAQRPINLRYRLEPHPLPYDPSSMCPYTLSCLSFDGQDDADFDESQRLDLPFNQRDRDDVFFP